MKPLEPKYYLEYQEVKERLAELEKNEWNILKKGDAKEEFKRYMHHELTKELKIYPCSMLPYNGMGRLPFQFFRVRPVKEIVNPSLRTEFSYAPIYFSKTQRANLYGSPVFYASNDPLTALMEVVRNYKYYKDNPNEEYYLSYWRLKDSRKINLSFLLNGNISSENPFYPLVDFQNNNLENILIKDGLNKKQIEGVKLLFEFYSKVFLKDENYAISSYIADTHLYSDSKYRTDILMYPSLQTDSRSINFAIHPNFVDERMYLKAVFRLKVDDMKYLNSQIHSMTYTFKNYGIMKESSLIWRPDMRDSEEFQPILDEFRKLDYMTIEKNSN